MKTNFKMNGGFTLVELIVVIAILAILAGVAVPAYSGYIAKADAAADNTLLNAVNKAFAAACVENSINIAEIDGASIPVNANGEIGKGAPSLSAAPATQTVSFITAVTYEGQAVTAEVLAKINGAFARFYAGNENSTFKTIKARTLMFDPNKGLFVDPQNVEELTVTFGGNRVTISGAAISALANSTFGTEIGAEALLGEIHDLTLMFGADADTNSIMEQMNGEGTAYTESLMKYLGTNDIDAWVAGNCMDAEGNVDEAKLKNVILNGAVLYAAENSTSMTTERINALLTSDNIAGNMTQNNQATKLAEAAMLYGMYTSYVNSDYFPGETKPDISDPMDAIRALNGDGSKFQDYVKSEQGKADLDAYMSAMEVIRDGSANSGAASDVLTNGFTDPELIALLQQAMGK